MEQVFIIDDGATVRQREYEVYEGSENVVRAVRMLSRASDERELVRVACQAAWELFSPCEGATLTKKSGSEFHVIGAFWNGREVPHDEIERDPSCEGDIVPRRSLSHRIEQTGRSILWREGNGNIVDSWFDTPLLFGAPWMGPDGSVSGALVVSSANDVVPSDQQVFSLQLIMEAFSSSFVMMQRNRDSLALGRELGRGMMAQVIHDSVAQNVFSLQLKARHMLTASDLSAQMLADLRELESIVDETRRELHGIILNEKSRLSGESLRARVEEEIAEHGRLSGPPVTLVFDDMDDVSGDIADLLVLAVEEGLLNVRKHAGARFAFVAVTHRERSVVVSVVDEGRGLGALNDSAQRAGMGFGVRNLRTMVEVLGGSVTLSNAENGSGSMLRVELPLGEGMYG